MIVIENLNYRYDKQNVNALDGICLKIEKGTLFGLLGPNGAGKTTLISILVGLLSERSGSVSIAGRNMKTESKKIKSRQGFVPQEYAFYSNLTAQENLQFFAGIQSISVNVKKRIDECLDFCQLQSVRKQKSSTFSGGLKRRLNLAIGLLSDPDILYLDEPTVGIDPQSRAFILDKIKTLNAEGKTIIYTSHYMEEIEYLCDRVAIVDHGKMLFEGTLNELNAKGDAFTSVCFEKTLTKELEDLIHEKFQFQFHKEKQRLIFSDLNSMHQLQQLIHLFESLKLKPSQINFGKSSLEQVFLNLTERKLRD